MIAGRSASTASRMIISSVEIGLHCIRLLAFTASDFSEGLASLRVKLSARAVGPQPQCRPGWQSEMQMSAVAMPLASRVQLTMETMSHPEKKKDSVRDWEWAKAGRYFPNDAAARSRHRFL